MSLRLNSSGGGSVTLQEPTTASTLTLSLPAVTGTVITTADTATVTPTMLSQKLTLATAQNTTSGTAIDFTGIPSWVRRINVMLNGVSTNGSANYLVQIGAGSVTSTGYVGSAAANVTTTGTSYTTGFGIRTGGATDILSGMMTICLMNTNLWIASGVFGHATQGVVYTNAGSVTLSGTLDRIRLTTVNGTDTFDAGSVNIMYEG